MSRKKTPWHIISGKKHGRKFYVAGIEERGKETKVHFTQTRQHARYYQSAGSAIHDAKWIGIAFEMTTSVEPL